jgi:hypothetical protein
MSALNIDKAELIAEIEALQKQAQEAQARIQEGQITIFKVEGALQFAHHLLRQIEAEEGDHKTVAAESENK